MSVVVDRMSFVAIDVETANSDPSSICQIGIADYRQGELIEEWTTLVDPNVDFNPVNTSVHGIRSDDVHHAPSLTEIHEKVSTILNGRIVVSHSQFDRNAMQKAFRKENLPQLTCRWLDSARVVRATWSQCARKGYGLQAVCQMIGYEFRHHDALEDAKAAAHVMLHACRETGRDVFGWETILQSSHAISQDGRRRDAKVSDSESIGENVEVVAFTGTLAISRRAASMLTESIGYEVTSGVSSRSTILVVGDHEFHSSSGEVTSTKYKKAQELIANGKAIRIIGESEFMRIVDEKRDSV